MDYRYLGGSQRHLLGGVSDRLRPQLRRAAQISAGSATAALDAGHEAWLREKRFDAYTAAFRYFAMREAIRIALLAALLGDDVDIAALTEQIEELLQPEASAEFAALVVPAMSDDQIILMNEANQAATQNASTAVDWLARATPDDRPACKTRSRRPSRLHLRLTAGLETLCAVTWLGGPALRLPAAKALAAQDQQLRAWLTMTSLVRINL